MIRLNYLILETSYIPFSLYSVGILVLHTLSTLYLCFQVLATTTFPFFWLLQPSLFCVCFYNFKKENIYI